MKLAVILWAHCSIGRRPVQYEYVELPQDTSSCQMDFGIYHRNKRIRVVCEHSGAGCHLETDCAVRINFSDFLFADDVSSK
jgi:hypothetical protein